MKINSEFHYKDYCYRGKCDMWYWFQVKSSIQLSHNLSLTHTHTKGQRDRGLKAAYSPPPHSAQFHIVCRKQNLADIYEAGVGRSLIGNLTPPTTRLCNPLSLPSSHTHTPLHNEQSRKHSDLQQTMSAAAVTIYCRHCDYLSIMYTHIHMPVSRAIANIPEPHNVSNTFCRDAQLIVVENINLRTGTGHALCPRVHFIIMLVYF